MLDLNALKTKLKNKYGSAEYWAIRQNILNALPYWVGAVITGLVAVLYAQIFAWAEFAMLYVYGQHSWLLFIITPLLFVGAWYIVKEYSPFSRGSGIPQVMASIELSSLKDSKSIDKLLGFRVVIIKIASSFMMVLGGGVIGREGPTIQISASIFKKINSSLPHWYPKISMQQMIVTGAAAGLASAFNTPLGGIVFAIEELTKKHFNIFKSALLTGVIIAGLTSLYLLGNYLYLGFPDLQGIGYKILYAVIPVAVIAGLAGSGMGAAILWIFKQKNRLRTLSSKIGYIAACGLLIATLAFFIDHRILGSGKEIMVSTLFGAEKHVEWYLPFLRLFGSIASFTCGASGGIFAPSLSTGASIGSSLAGLLQLSPTDTNLVILCGMTAFLTGITRSPFTASILVLEMTNTHTVIFHLMLTALIANLIANLLGRHSFYDQLKVQYINEIERMEEPLQPAKQQAPLFNNQGAGI